MGLEGVETTRPRATSRDQESLGSTMLRGKTADVRGKVKGQKSKKKGVQINVVSEGHAEGSTDRRRKSSPSRRTKGSEGLLLLTEGWSSINRALNKSPV